MVIDFDNLADIEELRERKDGLLQELDKLDVETLSKEELDKFISYVERQLIKIKEKRSIHFRFTDDISEPSEKDFDNYVKNYMPSLLNIMGALVFDKYEDGKPHIYVKYSEEELNKINYFINYYLELLKTNNIKFSFYYKNRSEEELLIEIKENFKRLKELVNSENCIEEKEIFKKLFSKVINIDLDNISIYNSFNTNISEEEDEIEGIKLLYSLKSLQS